MRWASDKNGKGAKVGYVIRQWNHTSIRSGEGRRHDDQPQLKAKLPAFNDCKGEAEWVCNGSRCFGANAKKSSIGSAQYEQGAVGNTPAEAILTTKSTPTSLTTTVAALLSLMSKWKYNVIDFYRAVTRPYRRVTVQAMKRRKQLPVYTIFYHRISNDVLNDWTMTIANFTRQIEWLQDNFDIVSLEESQRRICSGENDRPTVSITFDDGYRENAEFAIPLLVERKIPATYFVTTDHTLNQKPFDHDVQLSSPLVTDNRESLRAYANGGIEIGAHTRTHPNMALVQDPAAIVDEVIIATREMEAAIGRPIRYFAFPYGLKENLNPIVFHLLRESGFLGVCSAYGGWNSIGDDAFHLQRIHGDPVFARFSNALTYDPRLAYTKPYDYSIDPTDVATKAQLELAIALANQAAPDVTSTPELDRLAIAPPQPEPKP